MWTFALLILTSLAKKNDVTVAVNTDSISENGFEFSYDFDSVVPGAVMYYSLTEAGVQRYTAEDVQQGFDSIYHGSEDDVDTSRHTVTVNIPLEVSQTYLLWVAFGVGNDLELMKTNIVHVPKPCPEFVDIPHASSSCVPNSETCVATCDEGFGPGNSEFYCEIDGTWSGDLECLPMGCPSSINVPHAKSECTDTGVGAMCNVYCEQGYEGQGQYVCQLDGTWSGEVSCTERQAPVQCPSTVPGVQNGVSQCSDTSDGARCDVSCEDGYNGGGTYTCQGGNWVGNAVCEANQAPTREPQPVQPARFALWASGQFCEPEDFEHIYFGPVTSAAECAYKVSKNPYCTNKFYTGCCGSAVCACVRVGMRCELEESDEEYLGTNVYQLIGTGHPNDCFDNCDEAGMFGGFNGGFNQGGFPGGNQGGFPGGSQGGFPGGFNQGGFPGMPGGQGGFPGGEDQGQGGFPGGENGGFPGGFPGMNGGNNNFNNGGFNGGAEVEQGSGQNPFGWNDNSWMPGTGGEGAEIEGQGGFPPLGPDRGTPDVGGAGCRDTIDGCKDLKASGMCAVVTECPMTCGSCNASPATYAVSQQNAYCKSMLNGRTVIKELSAARGAEECANAAQEEIDCSSIFTASNSFCACVLRGETCEPDPSQHGNSVYYLSTRLGSALPCAGGNRAEGEDPFMNGAEGPEAEMNGPMMPFLAKSSQTESTSNKKTSPIVFVVLALSLLAVIGGLVFWRARAKRHQYSIENIQYYVSTEA